MCWSGPGRRLWAPRQGFETDASRTSVTTGDPELCPVEVSNRRNRHRPLKTATGLPVRVLLRDSRPINRLYKPLSSTMLLNCGGPKLEAHRRRLVKHHPAHTRDCAVKLDLEVPKVLNRIVRKCLFDHQALQGLWSCPHRQAVCAGARFWHVTRRAVLCRVIPRRGRLAGEWGSW